MKPLDTIVPIVHCTILHLEILKESSKSQIVSKKSLEMLPSFAILKSD